MSISSQVYHALVSQFADQGRYETQIFDAQACLAPYLVLNVLFAAPSEWHASAVGEEALCVLWPFVKSLVLEKWLPG